MGYKVCKVHKVRKVESPWTPAGRYTNGSTSCRFDFVRRTPVTLWTFDFTDFINLINFINPYAFSIFLSENKNSNPPSFLFLADISPLWKRTAFFTIESPKPEPPD